MPLASLCKARCPLPKCSTRYCLRTTRHSRSRLSRLDCCGGRSTSCFSKVSAASSRVDLLVDARSVVCRDGWLKSQKQRRVTTYVRDEALSADRHPEIRFSSTRIRSKPLRGFVVEGELKIRGVSRIVKVNVVLSPRSQDRFQLDGDTTICLSDFGLERPSSLLGLVGTKDEALIHLLLWATPDGASVLL